MLGGRGRDGTICGCFETFVQTDHLGGGWRRRIVEGLGGRGVSHGAVPSPGPFFILNSGLTPALACPGCGSQGSPSCCCVPGHGGKGTCNV